MFGIGMSEMLVIAVIALIFIGPDQIPEVARTIGRFINDLKKSTDDLKREFHQQSGLPKNFDEWMATQDRPAPVKTLTSASSEVVHDLKTGAVIEAPIHSEESTVLPAGVETHHEPSTVNNSSNNNGEKKS